LKGREMSSQEQKACPATCPGRSCREALLRWAIRRTDNRDDAEDMVGEVCLHCSRSMHQFRGEAEFATWQYRIARNVLNDFFAAKQRRKRVQAEVAAESFRAARQSAAAMGREDLPETEPVRLALCRLAPRQRHLIEWKYGDGLSCAEIAARLGVSEAAA